LFSHVAYPELIACQSLLAGNWGQALIEFEIAIKSIRKTTGRHSILESETSIQLDFDLGSIEQSIEFLLQLKSLVDSQQVS